MTALINKLITKVLLATQGMRLAREETLATGGTFPPLPQPITKKIRNYSY